MILILSKKMNKVITAMIAILLLAPAAGFGQQAAEQTKPGYQVVIECEGKSNTTPIPGTNEKKCDFTDFMNQIDKIIKLLLYVAVLLAIISFVYAGFKMIFSGGNEEAVKLAKHIFINVVVGLVLVYGAWIIVHFIVTTLGVNKGYSLIE
jgi:type IV secretory pathway VirB2 component (pilin)